MILIASVFDRVPNLCLFSDDVQNYKFSLNFWILTERVKKHIPFSVDGINAHMGKLGRQITILSRSQGLYLTIKIVLNELTLLLWTKAGGLSHVLYCMCKLLDDPRKVYSCLSKKLHEYFFNIT